METNNIFTESYDTPIIDDSLDNEIDILSTDDVTTMEYDEIPDYAAVSVDEDERTVTLARFCEKFKNMIISTISADRTYTYENFDFYNSDSTGVDIRNIDNLLDFVMWDGNYVTQSFDVNPNKLMSLRTIEEHVTFNVFIRERMDSAIEPGADDIYITDAIVTASVNTIGDIPVNKIIALGDFKDLYYPPSYFRTIECAPDGECEIEWTCDAEDPDCDPQWCDWVEPSF